MFQLGAIVRDSAGNKAIYSPRMRYAWTARTLPSSQLWNAVAYGGGTFVAVAGGPTNVAASSTDGINWTARTIPSGTWQSVAYGGGTFVAVKSSSEGTAADSKDEIKWTKRN